MNTKFPIDLLPYPLNEYVKQAAVTLCCDPSYVAVPLLPVIASAIGNTRRIRLKESWCEPAVIWAVVVGESGTVKSPALELATKPIWRRQCKLLKAHEQATAEHKAERIAWKATPKDERGDEPEPPTPCEHPICSDITVEALADRLQKTSRGTLVSRDELSGWFGSFNQYKAGGADVEHWLTMHSARALKVDRKTGDKTTIYISHAAVSVTGTIQPKTLKRVLLPEFFDNGLVARLLVVMPPMTRKQWTDREIGPQVQRAMDELFDKLYAMRAAPGVGGDDEPLAVDLDDNAKALWVTFYDQHNSDFQQHQNEARAAMAKLEGYAARFALILHCIRQASGEKQSDYIDEQDMKAGIELARWFGREALRVYAMMNEDEPAQQRRELLERIHRMGCRVTPRMVKEHCRRYRTSDDAEAALQELVDEALGSWETLPSGPRGGKPATYFVLADSPDYPARSVPVTPEMLGNLEVCGTEHAGGGEHE